MDSFAYKHLLRTARRVTRRADEAEDLLQTVLLAAVEAGRTDLTSADTRAWIVGALRKRALFDARSAVRRRRRENAVVPEQTVAPTDERLPTPFLNSLTPALRSTALLALSGHTKREIGWLLRVSDATLRKRIEEVRRRWRAADGSGLTDFHGLQGSLAFGRLRQPMLRPVRRGGALLASHDPDGHIFVVRSENSDSSQNCEPRQPVSGKSFSQGA